MMDPYTYKGVWILNPTSEVICKIFDGIFFSSKIAGGRILTKPLLLIVNTRKYKIQLLVKTN